MSSFDSSLKLTALGWATVVGFGVAVALGEDSAANGAVFAVLGAAMGAWVWFRRSRPALIVSLVLGMLHVLEQAAYSVADIGNSEWGTLAVDLAFLLGGLLIVVGAIGALRSLRRVEQPA